MTLCTFFKNFKKYTFKNIVRVFIIKHHLTGTGDKSAKFREKNMYISPVWKIQKMVKNPCLLKTCVYDVRSSKKNLGSIGGSLEEL